MAAANIAGAGIKAAATSVATVLALIVVSARFCIVLLDCTLPCAWPICAASFTILAVVAIFLVHTLISSEASIQFIGLACANAATPSASLASDFVWTITFLVNVAPHVVVLPCARVFRSRGPLGLHVGQAATPFARVLRPIHLGVRRPFCIATARVAVDITPGTVPVVLCASVSGPVRSSKAFAI